MNVSYKKKIKVMKYRTYLQNAAHLPVSLKKKKKENEELVIFY